MMNDRDSSSKSQHRVQLGFWISVFRGFLAITLGLVLLFNPDKSRTMLFNFMGFFWLLSGIALVRRTHAVFGQDTVRVFGARLSRVIGVVAIVTGLLVVTRSLTGRWFDEGFLFQLLGGVILLTGVLHLLGEFRVGRVIKLRRTTAQKALAVFEIILGALLLISPLDRSPVVYWTATVWALVGGAVILADALTTRAQKRRQEQGSETQSEAQQEAPDGSTNAGV